MIKVGIVGVTGYAGEELLKILSGHPNVKITGLYGKSFLKEKYLKDIYPNFTSRNLKNFLKLKIEPLNTSKIAANCDIVFLALPHAIAIELVPSIIKMGIKVIDLSADFRLTNPELYEKWYNINHPAKEYIRQAVYGLPELNVDRIKKASLIANPGCYPTSVILGCAPAIKNGFVNLSEVIIDSKSGISGAGRRSANDYYDGEHPNFRAYKIAGSHRHIPEIEQELSVLANRNVMISFTPHIMPVERGMLSTIYLNLQKQLSTYTIVEIYKEFYKNNTFVQILDEDIMPGIKDVVNTNYCKIGMKVDNRIKKLTIISVIDNLVKGASGQAIQNMNIIFGLPETTGLM
ncbi:MAG: N-acetyl-gamma-glutamyl-phosphate reductase [Endomicrobium sp.]|jgi:N-acetyl-gamma-glutamyl-phosphate reductase|nr:N-acetyl-gamma-glutamyl-phosphate reductase [Endomicrobium sp.]